MDRQDFFNHVARHLLTQRKRAVNPAQLSQCQYRTPAGFKCAIGCRIQDEKYSPDLEGRSVYHPKVQEALGLGELTRSDEMFLNGLQSIHDAQAVDLWKHHLSEFGKTYDLDLSVLEEFPR